MAVWTFPDWRCRRRKTDPGSPTGGCWPMGDRGGGGVDDRMALEATSEDRPAEDREWVEARETFARMDVVPEARDRGRGPLPWDMTRHPLLIALVAVILGALVFAILSRLLF
jgi:hypothetical protein